MGRTLHRVVHHAVLYVMQHAVHHVLNHVVSRSSPCPSEWAVPRVAGRFSDSETSWVLAGGVEGSFLCSPSSRFSGRGGGVGSLPRAWRRVGVPTQGRRGQFSVQSDNRFSGRGGGVGSLP